MPKRRQPKALREYWAKKRGKKNPKRKKKNSRRKKPNMAGLRRYWAKMRAKKNPTRRRKTRRTRARRRNRTIIKTRIIRRTVYRNPPRRKKKSQLTFPVRVKSSSQKRKINAWLGRNFKRR